MTEELKELAIGALLVLFGAAAMFAVWTITPRTNTHPNDCPCDLCIREVAR